MMGQVKTVETTSDPEMERVHRLHRHAPVIDSMIMMDDLYFFTDDMLALAVDMDKRGLSPREIFDEIHRQRTEALIGRPDLRRACRAHFEKAGVTAISITLGDLTEQAPGPKTAVHDLASWTRRFDECEDLFVKVKRTEDIRLAHRTGRVGIILNFQNLAYIEGDLDKLTLFHALGIRIAQPTYNNQNLLGSGCTERVDSGLSYFGVDVIHRMNELGIAVDLSHSGPATTADAISVSRRPVICSHVGVRALTDNPRNKTDDQLRAVAATGGYIGICTLPLFLAPRGRARLEDFLNHLEHAIEVVGVDHVGIGTDWLGSDVPPGLQAILDKATDSAGLGLRGDPEFAYSMSMKVEGAEGWSDWPNLTRGMVARGYSDSDIQKILGGNFLRVMDAIWE